MTVQRKSQLEIIVEQLDRELIARGAQTPSQIQFGFSDEDGTHERQFVMKQAKELYGNAPPLNNALSHIKTEQLVKLLMLRVQELNRERGIWGEDDRIDHYQITNEQIKKNADSVTAICMKKDFIPGPNGFFKIRTKNYGKSFNLCANERFREQPIAAGRLCTGFLVKNDTIATAAHCAKESNLQNLRFVFGFKIESQNSSTTAPPIPHENIYEGIKVIERVYDRTSAADWSLVKLDRSVAGHPIVTLCREKISLNQPVYILGHPVGLPLKYSAEAWVRDISNASFAADLNVYCGSSGSPVFRRDTHEVIGIVIRGDNRDFRWTGKGWASVIYPQPDFRSHEPQCTRVSEFTDYIR